MDYLFTINFFVCLPGSKIILMLQLQNEIYNSNVSVKWAQKQWQQAAKFLWAKQERKNPILISVTPVSFRSISRKLWSHLSIKRVPTGWASPARCEGTGSLHRLPPCASPPTHPPWPPDAATALEKGQKLPQNEHSPGSRTMAEFPEQQGLRRTRASGQQQNHSAAGYSRFQTNKPKRMDPATTQAMTMAELENWKGEERGWKGFGSTPPSELFAQEGLHWCSEHWVAVCNAVLSLPV